jgi:O-antigen ligase
MRNRTNLRTRLFLTLLIAYLAFLPAGPYPIYVGLFRVEYVLFALVCAASIPLLGSVYTQLRGPYGRVQLCLLGYLLIIGVSTALSSQPEVSTPAFLTTVSYAYLMCVVPPIVYRHMTLMRHALLWLSAGVAVLVLYLHLVYGYGGEQRFVLADSAVRYDTDTNYVDPNMTAIGMMMCVIIAVPLVLDKGRPGRWVFRAISGMTAVAVIGASLFFQSRTAVISILVAIFFGLVRAGMRIRRLPTVLGRAFLILSVLLVAAYLNRAEVQYVFSRLTSLDFDVSDSNGRVSLSEEALQDWLTSGKTVIIGSGYNSMNPHDEYLRSLTSGLIGSTSFLLLILTIYNVCCRSRRYTADQTLSQNLLFAFIFSAMLTYGHTKTIWVAFMFLLSGYIEYENRDVSSRRSSGIASVSLITPGGGAVLSRS